MYRIKINSKKRSIITLGWNLLAYNTDHIPTLCDAAFGHDALVVICNNAAGDGTNQPVNNYFVLWTKKGWEACATLFIFMRV